MKQGEGINKLLDKLIKDGEMLLASAVVDKYADDDGNDVKIIENSESRMQWANELHLFKTIAGRLTNDWSHQLNYSGEVEYDSAIMKPLTALRTIKFAVNEGLIAKYEDFIAAELFSDLSEQAQYLLSQGYYLASGVLLRAVLEERLRRLCDRHSCLPGRTNPTINDYNQALYGLATPLYDKVFMKHIEAMAAIGNDAAHNNQSLRREDVERLARDVSEFLVRYSEKSV